MIIVLVIAAFCMTGFRAGETVPPTHMLVLPISARLLVTVPMLAASVTIIGVWVVVASLVMWPADYRVPLVWPARCWFCFQSCFKRLRGRHSRSGGFKAFSRSLPARELLAGWLVESPSVLIVLAQPRHPSPP